VSVEEQEFRCPGMKDFTSTRSGSRFSSQKQSKQFRKWSLCIRNLVYTYISIVYTYISIAINSSIIPPAMVHYVINPRLCWYAETTWSQIRCDRPELGSELLRIPRTIILTAKPAPNCAQTNYYKYFASSCPDVLGKRAGPTCSFPKG